MLKDQGLSKKDLVAAIQELRKGEKITSASAEENFNAENLATLISKWNTIIDGYPCDMDGANILTPTEKRENHDFVWVLKWPSTDARNSCWDIWTNAYAADWDKTIDGIMSYDPNNAFMFSVKVGRTPKEENTWVLDLNFRLMS